MHMAQGSLEECRYYLIGLYLEAALASRWLRKPPEEIADRIGHLSLAQVYAALAYYHANRDEIDADIAAEEAEADRLEREHGLSR